MKTERKIGSEMQGNAPMMSDLVFWGTASAAHVVPQRDSAAQFGAVDHDVNHLYPDEATTAFSGNTDFTVVTWVKPTSTSAFAIQSPYSQLNVRERKFYFVNNDLLNYVGFGVHKDSPKGALVTTQNGLGKMVNDRWYRLVGIHKKGAEISLWVNGQFAGSSPWTDGVEAGNNGQQPWLGGFSLGGPNYDPDRYWRGLIGPTCYSSRVWTPREVAWDYGDGKGRRYADLGVAGTDGENLLNGLVAWWQLTEEDTGLGSYVVRRDSHIGQHHLVRSSGKALKSVAGILPKVDPIADDDRVEQLTDRSPRGNSIGQADSSLQPYWTAGPQVISMEAGAVFKNDNFTGLGGRRLSLYLVAVLNEGAENAPWLHLSSGGGADTGLKIYRESDTLNVKAWIGGRVRKLSYGLSYPAERLFEVHYDGARLSLWENGRKKVGVAATGGFDRPLDHLALGPKQGLKELLIYDAGHR